MRRGLFRALAYNTQSGLRQRRLHPFEGSDRMKPLAMLAVLTAVAALPLAA